MQYLKPSIPLLLIAMAWFHVHGQPGLRLEHVRIAHLQQTSPPDSGQPEVLKADTLLSVLHLPELQYMRTPFFCRIESALEKKSRIPVRFRLGSVDYVNRLEGKGYH